MKDASTDVPKLTLVYDLVYVGPDHSRLGQETMCLRFDGGATADEIARAMKHACNRDDAIAMNFRFASRDSRFDVTSRPILQDEVA